MFSILHHDYSRKLDVSEAYEVGLELSSYHLLIDLKN